MKLCRYNGDRLGVVDWDRVLDVTAVLDRIEPATWPRPLGDPLVANLAPLRRAIDAALPCAPALPLSDVALGCPVTSPSKIVAAPVNYRKHLEESRADRAIHFGRNVEDIEHYGLFLKACSSLVGAADGVALRFPDRRNDHEVELVAVIGKRADRVTRQDALAHVAGYCVGLDMTLRGTEDRSFRKSIDSYTVIGPWLVTADEIADPNALGLELRVNGELRQSSNTRHLAFDVERLIEYASSFYTLHPGDLLMTGTPEGVGPVEAGDEIVATIENIGVMTVRVRMLE